MRPTKAMDASAPNTPLKTEKNMKLDRPEDEFVFI